MGAQGAVCLGLIKQRIALITADGKPPVTCQPVHSSGHLGYVLVKKYMKWKHSAYAALCPNQYSVTLTHQFPKIMHWKYIKRFLLINIFIQQRFGRFTGNGLPVARGQRELNLYKVRMSAHTHILQTGRPGPH
jgi:hypothetical protein